VGDKMPKDRSYTVTVELSELELALVCRTAMEDRGERRLVLWEKEGRRERHYVSPHWLESKVFGQIAQARPGWMEEMEAARRRLDMHP